MGLAPGAGRSMMPLAAGPSNPDGPMFGILNLDKPPGLTSRDAVNGVQRLAYPNKVGHAGTLDPLATGVLVVCLGKATRLIEFVQQQPKHYLAEFDLGLTSDTEDIEGDVRQMDDAAPVSYEDIRNALPRFVGQIMQRPPAYSALKIKGRRAYKLARRGETVELAPRPINVYSLKLVHFHYPRVTLDIVCGSGTYVRSLGATSPPSWTQAPSCRRCNAARWGIFASSNRASFSN